MKTATAIISLLAGWQLGGYIGAGPLYVVEAEQRRFTWQVLILDDSLWNWFAQSAIEAAIAAAILFAIHKLVNMSIAK